MKYLIATLMVFGSVTFADEIGRSMCSSVSEFDPRVKCIDPCDKIIESLDDVESICCRKKYEKKLIKYRTKIKEVEKKVIVERIVEEKYPRNSLGLVLGLTRTGLTHAEGNKAVSVHTKHEGDIGLMYQRDLKKHLRFTVQGTVRKSLYLGLGLNF